MDFPAPHLPDLNPSPRLLLGPGPSMVHPRVLASMATPLLGHLDPEFLGILADIRRLLQYTFQTTNELTLAVSGTGTAGMEAALCNLIEPGDRVLACIQGFFGQRLAELALRHGATVETIEVPWGQVFDPATIRSALRLSPAKLVTLVHAETSTGARQPEIEAIARFVHEAGALLILDVVTSLGGLPVSIDAWDVDVAYSASQKGLSAPPGLAPLTVGPRALQVIQRRSRPPVFYLDLLQLQRYWSDAPAYHHTAPISTFYALREALRLVAEEGLPARYQRHLDNAQRLWEGLASLRLEMLVPAPLRLPTLSTPLLPSGIEDALLRRRLLDEFRIEIAGGFGPLTGKIWRIGLMGYSSQEENVDRLLAALRELLPRK